jgi:hypothetical protein
MEDDLISFSDSDNIKSGGYGSSNIDGGTGMEAVKGVWTKAQTNILLPKIAFYIYLIMTVLAIVAIIAASALAIKDGNLGTGITGMIFGIIAIAPLLFITFVLYNCKEGKYQST